MLVIISFPKNKQQTPIRASKGDHYGKNSDILLGQRSRNTPQVPRNAGRGIQAAALHILLPMAPSATTVRTRSSGKEYDEHRRLGFISSTIFGYPD